MCMLNRLFCTRYYTERRVMRLVLYLVTTFRVITSLSTKSTSATSHPAYVWENKYKMNTISWNWGYTPSFLKWTLLKLQKAKQSLVSLHVVNAWDIKHRQIKKLSYSRFYASTDWASEKTAWFFFREFRQIPRILEVLTHCSNFAFWFKVKLQRSSRLFYVLIKNLIHTIQDIPTGLVTNVHGPCLPTPSILQFTHCDLNAYGKQIIYTHNLRIAFSMLSITKYYILMDIET